MINTHNWAEGHSTGKREVDSTNECLLFLLEELFLNSLPCQGSAVSCPKLADLEHFLVRKFAREEELMAEAGFPGLDGHRADHVGLLQRLKTMRRELVCGAYDPDTVYTFLTDWAVDHVDTFDAEFGRFRISRPETAEERKNIEAAP